ncbi:MAG: hypothetical protein GF308_14710 [Candidatus Heimdallarchaeota archaeon]|nr:hypothetical protein [Candidatus Heimdallarchaeota archaeon]
MVDEDTEKRFNKEKKKIAEEETKNKLTILHLSDFHFMSKNCKNYYATFSKNLAENLHVELYHQKAISSSLLEKLKAFADAGNPDVKSFDAIIITGDLAFSGKKEEY